MELTKKQITYIENLLEEEGVKYWDMRIELLDHVVTDVENNIKNKEDFKKEVQNSFVSLGWKKNYNGSNFEDLLKERMKHYAKMQRKKFHVYLSKSVINFKKLCLFALLFISLYSLSFYESFFKKFLFVFFATSVLFYFYFLLKNKVAKSIQLNTSLYTTTISFGLLNIFLNVPKMFEINVFDYPVLCSLFFGFVIILSFESINFFIKEYKKVNLTYQKLIS